MACHRDNVGSARPTNNVKDSGEDLVDDAGVDHAPLVVTILGRGRRLNMALKAELAKRGVEEAAPLAIVGLVNVLRDQDVGANGDL